MLQYLRELCFTSNHKKLEKHNGNIKNLNNNKLTDE